MSFFDKVLPTGHSHQSSHYLSKCRWPELVGNHYLNAQQIVQREAPWAHVIFLEEGTEVDCYGHNMGRIIIFYHPITKSITQMPVRG